MVTEVELIMNPNYPEHSIFQKEWVTVGSSWLTDKWRTTLIGGIEGSTVVSWGESYDEDNDTVEECRYVIKECASEAEAIEFAKEHFSVTKVTT